MVTTIKLLELISARMFHDLAGPIGAINNSIEFLEEEDPLIKEKALQLMKSSAHESILRLKFFRQAYGGLSDNEIHLSTVFALAQEFTENSKITLNWIAEEEIINSYLAKVILNFVIIALNGMIQGGILSIDNKNDKITIILEGKNIIFNEDTKLLLEGDLKHISLSSANIQIYYTYLMLQSAKAKLTINKTTDALQFIIAS